jgi:phage terminase small subunit
MDSFQQNSNRTKQKREEVSLLDDQRSEMLKLSSALGFTPYARKQQGIVLKVEKADDPVSGPANTTKRRKASEVVGVRIPPRPRS